MTLAPVPVTAPDLTPDECETRFWARYGARLFGQPRKPQTAQEWFDAALMVRGLLRLDDLAERLEARLEAAAPTSRAAQANQRRRQSA